MLGIFFFFCPLRERVLCPGASGWKGGGGSLFFFFPRGGRWEKEQSRGGGGSSMSDLYLSVPLYSLF